MILGLGRRLVDDPGFYNSTPWFATVEENSPAGELFLAGLRTPPNNLILYAGQKPPAAAFRQLADCLIADQPDLPGVIGREEPAQEFARAWIESSGRPARLEIRERVFELRRVNPLPTVPGRMRPAGPADLDLLVRWTLAFNREALGEKNPAAEAADQAAKRLPRAYFWDDGQPVSLACISRETPHGAVVGPVYTPPELRGRGYASACVAALSQLLLDSGRQFCALFTNLANPTANHIYQVIGYQPRADFSVYRFDPVLKP